MERFCFSVFCCLLVITGAIHAEEFTTLEGVRYAGVTLKRVEPDGLVVSSQNGVVKLKFKDLSSEIQKKYGYNPYAEKDFLEKNRSDELRRFQIAQTLPKGHIIASFIPSSPKHGLEEKIKEATYNYDYTKKKIASLEQELSSGTSSVYPIQEELAKQRADLSNKEATLNKLLAEKSAQSTPSFLEQNRQLAAEKIAQLATIFWGKYGQYLLWSLVCFVGMVLFLRKKS